MNYWVLNDRHKTFSIMTPRFTLVNSCQTNLKSFADSSRPKYFLFLKNIAQTDLRFSKSHFKVK